MEGAFQWYLSPILVEGSGGPYEEWCGGELHLDGLPYPYLGGENFANP